jgi:hypothetical protein
MWKIFQLYNTYLINFFVFCPVCSVIALMILQLLGYSQNLQFCATPQQRTFKSRLPSSHPHLK